MENVQEQPPKTGSSKKKRTLVIAGSIIGALLVAGGTTAAFALQSANTKNEFDAVTQQVNESHQALLNAEAYEPQATYLYVEGWNSAKSVHLARVKNITGAPAELIEAKSLTDLKASVDAQMKLFSDKDAAPSTEAKKLHDEIAKQLTDDAHSFEPVAAELRLTSSEGAEVSREAITALQEEAAALQKDVDAATAKVDIIEEELDGFDAQVLADALLLPDAAAAGLKQQAAWVKTQSKATAEAQADLTKKGKALQAALDRYNGDAADEDNDTENAAQKSDSGTKADPTPAERLAFQHTVEDAEPTLADSRELVRTLSDFVKSAVAVKASHDETVAAEAAAAAAAEAEAAAAAAAASGATGYVDPGTGGWVDTGWSSGGGSGYVDQGWSGGGGYVPPASGGGDVYVPPATGGGGGGYVPPATGGGGCPAPPAGWYPTGGTANGCPTYSPPGGGGEDEW